MSAEDLAPVLVQLGCPEGKSLEMAAQLLRRADQLMVERHWTREEALRHLVGLMRGGWAARERGLAPG